MPRTWPVCVSDASVATVGDPEVADGQAPALVEQQVGGLDVAVDDVVAVRAVQRVGGLAQPAQRQRPRDRAAAAQAVGHRAAREVLHDHERAAVVLADVVDGDDVAALRQPRAGARLAQEAAVGALVLGVAGGEDLDRDEAAEQLVLGSPDGRHSPVGDVAHDPVARGQRDAMLGDRHSLTRYPSDRPATLRRRMAKVCHSCGRGPAFGNSRSHSMVATKRRFDPNLQKVRILVGKAPAARVRLHALPEGRQGHQGALDGRASARVGPQPRPLPRRAGRRVGAPGVAPRRRSTTSTSSRSPTATRATTWP